MADAAQSDQPPLNRPPPPPTELTLTPSAPAFGSMVLGVEGGRRQGLTGAGRGDNDSRGLPNADRLKSVMDLAPTLSRGALGALGKESSSLLGKEEDTLLGLHHAVTVQVAQEEQLGLWQNRTNTEEHAKAAAPNVARFSQAGGGLSKGHNKRTCPTAREGAGAEPPSDRTSFSTTSTEVVGAPGGAESRKLASSGGEEGAVVKALAREKKKEKERDEALKKLREGEARWELAEKEWQRKMAVQLDNYSKLYACAERLARDIETMAPHRAEVAKLHADCADTGAIGLVTDTLAEAERDTDTRLATSGKRSGGVDCVLVDTAIPAAPAPPPPQGEGDSDTKRGQTLAAASVLTRFLGTPPPLGESASATKDARTSSEGEQEGSAVGATASTLGGESGAQDRGGVDDVGGKEVANHYHAIENETPKSIAKMLGIDVSLCVCLYVYVCVCERESVCLGVYVCLISCLILTCRQK